MLENFDYNVKRTEDCALIYVNEWVQASDIIIQKINGRYSTSCIAEALKVHEKNYKNSSIKEGSYMLITSVAADVCRYTNFEIDGEKFFNLPIMQVLGVFKDNLINFNSLEMLYDKVLIEKIDINSYAGIILPETNEMIGKVVKIGTNSFDKNFNKIPLQVKINDVVLIKDNVSTSIRLDGKDYYAIEEKAIVGIIQENAEITFINESILMKPYYFKKLLNSTILEAPDINYEDLDYSEVYNRDLFQIKYIYKSVKSLQIENIVLAKRDYTNYVYLNQEKYFLLNGKDYIEAKLELGE